MSRTTGHCVICGGTLIMAETDYPYVIKTPYVEHKPVCAICFNLWYDKDYEAIGRRFVDFIKVRDSAPKASEVKE